MDQTRHKQLIHIIIICDIETNNNSNYGVPSVIQNILAIHVYIALQQNHADAFKWANNDRCEMFLDRIKQTMDSFIA